MGLMDNMSGKKDEIQDKLKSTDMDDKAIERMKEMRKKESSQGMPTQSE